MSLSVRLYCTDPSRCQRIQDNLDRVEALIKKHEDFEKTLDTQEEKFTMLDQFAKKLLSGSHYDTVAISKRRDAVLARCVCVCVGGGGGGVRVSV